MPAFNKPDSRNCKLPCATVLRNLTLLLTTCLAVCAVQAQSRAAQVMAVTGNVTAVDMQGRERTLEKGADVRQGDKIVTGEGALVQMRMTDGGYISVRSATEMAIDRFNYDDKEAANSSVLFSLIKGGFRSITGLIGRTNPGAYSVRTTTATVGIRGTDHEPVVVLPGAPGGVPAGLYDKVNDGETFIRTERGQLALLKGQVGFAPIVPDRPPQALPSVPEFYRIEIKTDARDPKDAANTSKAGDGDKLADPSALRPSLAARREAVKEAAKDSVGEARSATLTNAGTMSNVTTTGATSLRSAVIDAAGSTVVDKAAGGVLAAPAATATLKDAATVLAPATLSTLKDAVVTAPAVTDKALATTVVNPVVTTTVAPAVLSTTLTAPALTSIAPTVVAPTVVAPTLVAPVTTVAPVTSTLKSTIITAPAVTSTIKSVITR